MSRVDLLSELINRGALEMAAPAIPADLAVPADLVDAWGKHGAWLAAEAIKAKRVWLLEALLAGAALTKAHKMLHGDLALRWARVRYYAIARGWLLHSWGGQTRPIDQTAEEVVRDILVARWICVRDFWQEAQGHHAHELTGWDRGRVAHLEGELAHAVTALQDARSLEIMAEWQRATLPLRWMPHGRRYMGGAGYDAQMQDYEREAQLRGADITALCRTHGCGGSCQ